jgi:protein-S-isoprenylcysteine O-methyltransferase Ste14
MSENAFRLVASAIFVAGASISVYFRSKADRDSGERVSSASESRPVFLALRLGGLLLWPSAIAYLLNPNWMAWSSIGLPVWLRSLGIAGGVGCVGLIYWLFSSIGTGITPTVATRTRHQLVTTGPYRWVRHPLYSVGTAFFLSIALIADNWFIALLAILAFCLLALRTSSEEAHLIARFGDEYRAYMAQTARFLPKLF